MHLIKRISEGLTLCLIYLALTVQESMAANWGDRAADMTNMFKSFGGLARSAIVLIGIVLIGASLLGIYKAKETRESIGKYILGLIIGICMCSITLIISISSESVTGTDSSELDAIGL